jgi:transcriptional regulator with XRE-family HTH domain
LRAACGISLREAEKLTGVTRETLGALEHGQRGAHTGTLQKIATGYGVSVSDLLREGLEAEEVLLSKAEASEAEAAIAQRSPEASVTVERPVTEQSPLAQVTLDAPHIRAWLSRHHAATLLMSDQDFEDEVITSDPDALLYAASQERERILEELDKPEARVELFPTNVAGMRTKKARTSEAMRPYRQIGRLRMLAEREYRIREHILKNYIHRLSLIDMASDETRREAFREERQAALV